MDPPESGTWEWPDEFDALVAAPDHHRLLLENDDVRVLETRIGPGETAPLHTHRWPCVLHTVATTHFVRRDAEGHVLTDTRGDHGLPPAGATAFLPPMPPHTVENTGTGEIVLFTVELKRSG